MINKVYLNKTYLTIFENPVNDRLVISIDLLVDS